MSNKVTSLVRSEPVRLYLYSVLVPLLALLVAYGVVTAETVPLVLALAGAVLAVGGVEAGRKKVTSQKTLEEKYTPLHY